MRKVRNDVKSSRERERGKGQMKEKERRKRKEKKRCCLLIVHMAKVKKPESAGQN